MNLRLSWSVLLVVGALAPTPALAEVPVLHATDDTEAARARVARVADLDPSNIALHTVGELAAELSPFTARAAPLRACTQEGFPPADRTAEALRISIRDVMHDEAIDIGGRLLDLLPCQAPGAHRAELALSWYRYGYVLALERQLEPARAAFSQALVFDPSLDWDVALAPDGAPTFYAARDALQSAKTARLRVSPTPDELRLDGQLVDPEEIEATPLVPGWHVVEVSRAGGATTAFAVKLSPGSQEALLLPSLIEDDHLYGVLDGDLLLAAVVDQSLPAYAPAWAVDGRQVWTRPTAGAPWQPATALVDHWPARLKWAALGVGGVGVALLGTGATINLLGVRDATEATTQTAYSQAEVRYALGQSLYRAGWGAVTAGGAAGVGALLLTKRGTF